MRLEIIATGEIFGKHVIIDALLLYILIAFCMKNGCFHIELMTLAAHMREKILKKCAICTLFGAYWCFF